MALGHPCVAEITLGDNSELHRNCDAAGSTQSGTATGTRSQSKLEQGQAIKGDAEEDTRSLTRHDN